MEIGQMKNIVVLKNLPSNIVEEAIVVLKPNQKVKQTQYIEKVNGKDDKKENKDSKDYIVKEAQMVISNYISNIEKSKSTKSTSQMNQKYNRLKLITFLLGGIIVFNIILSFIK